jgi:RNA polymerase sigma factor (sigma-70 family)
VVPMWSGNKPAPDGVLGPDVPRSFEEVVLPHLDAAFNYARWLTKNEADAEDVVQDAYVRALRFFSSLRGEDARAWLFTIVRNTWYGRFPRRAGSPVITVADEEADNRADASLDPEAQLIQQQTVEEVRRALETLPTDFREVLVLRELEGLSYKEIAAIVGIPLGTVMSRLARARERLAGVLTTSERSGGHRGLP